jgi:hypothetical protein
MLVTYPAKVMDSWITLINRSLGKEGRFFATPQPQVHTMFCWIQDFNQEADLTINDINYW